MQSSISDADLRRIPKAVRERLLDLVDDVTRGRSDAAVAAAKRLKASL